MSSAAQIEANRRNCQKNAGPRNQEGRNSSRSNAVKDGLRAENAVIDGEVDVKLGDVVVETVGPGGILVEVALVDSGPRSASAVARVESRLARVDQREFVFLVQEHPTFALQVMTVMAERIRRTNESARNHAG